MHLRLGNLEINWNSPTVHSENVDETRWVSSDGARFALGELNPTELRRQLAAIKNHLDAGGTLQQLHNGRLGYLPSFRHQAPSLASRAVREAEDLPGE